MDNVTFIDSAASARSSPRIHKLKSPGRFSAALPSRQQVPGSAPDHQMLTVFDVYNTEAEAVASFSKGAGA